MIETRCYRCNKVLTTKDGIRLESANFSGHKDKPRNTDSITWALCDDCLEEERNEP